MAATNTALSGKAPTAHTHDDRYYTETEVNTLLDRVNRPDMSNIKSGIGHGYVTPSDGILTLCFAVTGNCDCRLRIGNLAVARIRWQGGTVTGSSVFPVTTIAPAGMNVTVEGLGSTVSISDGYFIPFSA